MVLYCNVVTVSWVRFPAGFNATKTKQVHGFETLLWVISTFKGSAAEVMAVFQIFRQ